MSLSRLALRIAAVEALRTDPVLAPLHGGRVYDSRMGEFDVSEPSPVLVVYTDDDAGPAFSANNGGVPFEQSCELVVEIGARMIEVYGEEATLQTPTTDRRLDALIDFIEARVATILTVGEGAFPAAIRQCTSRFTATSSKRYRDEELGERLAVRELTLTARMNAEDTETIDDGGTYVHLPDPLRAVCRLTTEGSDMAAVCTLLNSAMEPGADASGLLAGVDMTFVPSEDIGIEAMAPGEFGAAVEAGDYDAPDGSGTQFGATAAPET